MCFGRHFFVSSDPQHLANVVSVYVRVRACFVFAHTVRVHLRLRNVLRIAAARCRSIARIHFYLKQKAT